MASYITIQLRLTVEEYNALLQQIEEWNSHIANAEPEVVDANLAEQERALRERLGATKEMGTWDVESAIRDILRDGLGLPSGFIPPPL